MKETFKSVMEWVFAHEGGYSDDPRDSGNWTGGAVGKGDLKGTKFGISAKAYPKLDIRSLTKDRAQALYKRDYWDKVRADDLPAGLDYVAFDAAVNSGPAQSARWIQRAVGIEADGIVGERTLAKVADRDVADVIHAACNQRLAFMRSLKTWKTYGKGWSRRVADVRENALRLALQDKRTVEPKLMLGAERKARVEDVKPFATKDGKTTLGAGLAAAGVAATQAAEQLAPHAQSFTFLKIAFVCLTLIGVGIGAWFALNGLASRTTDEVA